MRLVGDSDCDPIIRSIAARTGCELPVVKTECEAIISRLKVEATSDATYKTIPHLIGSLSVRVEDGTKIATAAWCYFAEQLSNFVQGTAWPLRTLLFLLSGKENTEAERQSVGLAARRLLELGLSDAKGSNLVNAAIGFVGDTFATDAASSKQLLQRLFNPQRFKNYGHEDIPWLTRKIGKIAEHDQNFAAEIFKYVFSESISDQSETSIGGNRILPLRSNRRQDYEMAQWTLSEYFPTFLSEYPGAATIALVEATRGYVDREHPVQDSSRMHEATVNGRSIRLIEDWSYIWAHDLDNENGDNALKLVVAFVRRMREAPSQGNARTVSCQPAAIPGNRLNGSRIRRCEPSSGQCAGELRFALESDDRRAAHRTRPAPEFGSQACQHFQHHAQGHV